jgi:hypothetical protein
MAEVDVMENRESDPTALAAEATATGGDKLRKPRATDGGPEILPDMGHYVTLVRKIRHRPLVAQWLQHLHPEDLPAIEWNHKVCASYKQSLFTVVAGLSGAIRQRVEEAAQRILLLSDDYGCEAVKSLLSEDNETEQQAVAAAGDKYDRALYLYLCRLADDGDRRFEQAETTRQQNRQWKSETYASHFRGPKAVDIALDDTLKDKLKTAIAAIYPQAPLQDVVIEHFQRRDLTQDEDRGGEDDSAPVWLHTIVVGFNGKETHWDKIVDGEVTTRHDQALQRITFSYEPSTGALSVFCDDRNARQELAKALRDVVLASDTEIAEMPLREFSLNAFGSPEVFNLLQTEHGDGIERISINQIKVAKCFDQLGADGGTHHISSGLTIHRDRRDRRDVYVVAREDHRLADLSGYELVQVKLVLRMAKQKERRAHNIVVQITAPNGLNDNAKTEDERQLVMRLLKRWQIVTEF